MMGLQVYWVRNGDELTGPMTIDQWMAYAHDHDDEINAQRSVAREEVKPSRPWWKFWQAIEPVDVSTVFLGLDHNHWGGPPLIFETMIFGGDYDQHQWRYSTIAEARAGHARVVAALKAGQSPG